MTRVKDFLTSRHRPPPSRNVAYTSKKTCGPFTGPMAYYIFESKEYSATFDTLEVRKCLVGRCERRDCKRVPNRMFQNEERTGRRGKLVELSDQDLQAVRRLLSLLNPPESSVEHSEAHRPKSHHASLVRKANAILVERRRRVDAFGSAMFGEPAWEILLLLYVMDSGPRQTIGALAKLAGITKSTALRWLEYLEGRQLIHKRSHPTDKRAAFVELTSRGRTLLEAYLSEAFIFND